MTQPTSTSNSSILAPLTSQDQFKPPHPSKKVIEQSYDKIAPAYLKWTSSFPSPRLTYLNKLIPLLPPFTSTSILDLGCGAGVPCTQILAQHTASLVAVDISATQLELARENVKVEGAGKVEFVKSDMHALSFPPETFDAVAGFYSIIHLPREEQVVLMERIWTWLKPGGYFLANFATSGVKESWEESWVVDGNAMFWSSWDKEGSLGMIRGVGFEVLIGEAAWEDEELVGGGKVSFLWVLARRGERTDEEGSRQEMRMVVNNAKE
jgi:SAM-dependent methyltransferase